MDPFPGQEMRNQVRAPWQNVLKFHFQTGARGDGRKKICDVFLTSRGKRRLPLSGSNFRNECGIDAGQRDEFG